MQDNKKVNKVLMIVFASVAALCVLGGIIRLLKGDTFESLYGNIIMFAVSSVIIIINFFILKGKLVFPAGIIKLAGVIIIYVLLVIGLIKDVIIKEVVSKNLSFNSLGALLLLLFASIGGLIILPRYLKTNIKHWKVLQTGKGTESLIKSILNDIPQVTYLFAGSDGWRIAGKSPYIDSAETFVLTDSKDLISKTMFPVSCRNKLNIYYPMHIDRKDLISFLEACFCYGFEKFAFQTDNGTTEISIKDVVNCKKDFVGHSETEFLHNYFIFQQKKVRKQAMAAAQIAQSPEEKNEFTSYKQKSNIAFDNALFYALCGIDETGNLLNISKEAYEMIGQANADNLIKEINAESINVVDLSETVILEYLFSKFETAEDFVNKSLNGSVDSKICYCEKQMENLDNCSEDEKTEIIRRYKYYCFVEEMKNKIGNFRLCIVTGYELKSRHKNCIFDADCVVDSTKGNFIDLLELNY